MNWRPHPGPQAAAIDARFVPELFFGGARGGGKSDFLLADYLQDVEEFGRHWQGILIRRTYPELQEVIRRSHEMYPSQGGVWHEQAKEWRFSSGACLRMRYLESLQDATRYQGHQFGWIAFDELTQWAEPDAFLMLFACLRWAEAEVPVKRIRATGNPGGAGHQWVRDRYGIQDNPRGFQSIAEEGARWSRMFIPSKVTDNPTLLERDPDYIERLKLVGSAELVRMWLEGDWNVVAGAYFSEFGPRHIIEPFPIPKHWPRHFGFDWGFTSPFCGLWAAVSSGKDDAGREVPYPKGSLVFYRETYGRQLPNPKIGELLKELSQGEELTQRVADPSIFKEDGGPSISEQIYNFGKGFILTPADNTRLAGWSQIRQRLAPEIPLLYIFHTCRNLIEQLQTIQHDERKPEDLDTTMNDHALDSARYLCMSRPIEKDGFDTKGPAVRKGRVRVADYVKNVRREQARSKV